MFKKPIPSLSGVVARCSNQSCTSCTLLLLRSVRLAILTTHKRLLSALFLMALLPSLSFADEQVQSLLKQADAYRQQAGAVKIAVSIDSYVKDVLDKNRLYEVHSFPQHRSLVVMQSTVEAGQMLLMLDDNYWLIMPKSSRPVRITPVQKLIGEASTGDIATLTWAGDYDGNIIERTDTQVTLNLQAQREGLTYEHITLTVDAKTNAPIRAELFVKSGKLAKRASFTLGSMNGKTMVTAMTLIDALQDDKRTEVRYAAQTESRLPEVVFNPQYLVQNRQLPE